MADEHLIPASDDKENDDRADKKRDCGSNAKDPDQQVPIKPNREQNPDLNLSLIFLGEVGAFIAWILADFLESNIFVSGCLFFFAIALLTAFGVHKVILSEVF